MYFLAINKFKENINKADIPNIIPSHIKWTNAMINEKKIVQAGKWGNIGGMSIIQAIDLSEATEILLKDPLIQSGIVNFELEVFYPDVEII